MKPQDNGGDNRETQRVLFSCESYGKILDRVLDDFLSENAQLDHQRAKAPDLLTDLMALSANQRRLLIHNSPHYRGWPLIEEALGQCRGRWSDDPELAEDFARLALEMSESLELTGYREKLLHDLKAEIWSHIGNCLRIRSDLHTAHEAFAVATDHLAQGTGDFLERARLLDLQSSLLRAQRDFAGATRCLGEAIHLYARFPDHHAEGRARLKQAMLLLSIGQPGKAVGVLERAGTLIDVEREPRLRFLLTWNLALAFLETGRFSESEKLLPEARELSRSLGTRHDRLRLLWVEGLLRMKLGQSSLAEEALRQVREGFIAAGIGYDVALVSLDLAALYLESGKNDKVRRLAVETMPIFVSRNVQRELLVAWQLFKEAAEKDVATLRLIEEVATRIRAAEGAAPQVSKS